jgi:hypothetical protein
MMLLFGTAVLTGDAERISSHADHGPQRDAGSGA